MDWITKKTRKPPKNPQPNRRRESCGSLKPTTVVIRRWEAKGMFQSAPALSLLMPRWTWPCGVHKALIFLLTVGDYSAGSWAAKMCSRRSPRQRERENKQWAPWCHFYSHFSDSSHAFIRGTWSKQFRGNGFFLAVGRGCSSQIRYSIDKHNATANKEHKTGWLITTCLLPMTPITLEAMRPMHVQPIKK